MGKNAVKRSRLRLKCKRRAAALMGAAIMTGAVLSGIPSTKAFAAEAPSDSHHIKIEQSQKLTKDSRPPGRGWHEHKSSWPSPDENQAWYQDGKIYYRSDTNRGDTKRHEYAYTFNNPVNFVKDNAAGYGFDAFLDSFTLLTSSRTKAVVEVRRHDSGALYNVFLERTNGHDWTIVAVQAV